MATIKQKLYWEKLKDVRWQKIKNSIQIRDEFTCQKCGKKEDCNLQVHHRHYLKDRDPWDYPEQLLILLCSDCHKQEEDSRDVIYEMANALHFWGYFNTEIVAEINRLIEIKMAKK